MLSSNTKAVSIGFQSKVDFDAAASAFDAEDCCGCPHELKPPPPLQDIAVVAAVAAAGSKSKRKISKNQRDERNLPSWSDLFVWMMLASTWGATMGALGAGTVAAVLMASRPSSLVLLPPPTMPPGRLNEMDALMDASEVFDAIEAMDDTIEAIEAMDDTIEASDASDASEASEASEAIEASEASEAYQQIRGIQGIRGNLSDRFRRILCYIKSLMSSD